MTQIRSALIREDLWPFQVFAGTGAVGEGDAAGTGTKTIGVAVMMPFPS